ncbi:hypothetical protein R1flu_027265 [Riccia fluitans]|uniref:F-box/kelch-repeat protein n=1 Tax=Riccia fluitans TaxID=41844 RepID=A0ABD1XIA1_9MARC
MPALTREAIVTCDGRLRIQMMVIRFRWCASVLGIRRVLVHTASCKWRRPIWIAPCGGISHSMRWLKTLEVRHPRVSYDSCPYRPGPVGMVGTRYLEIPNTKANVWEKHILDFASEVIFITADVGLICFSSTFSRTLFVYNPLTRHVRTLTVPENTKNWDRGKPLVGLAVDLNSGSYKLVVGFVEVLGKGGVTHIYDSLTSTWTSTSLCPQFPRPDVRLLRDILSKAFEWMPKPSLHSCGNLYWVVEEAMDLAHHHHSIW